MMLTITTNSFENDVLRADKPVLVDFWAQWCPYCRRIAPAFDTIPTLMLFKSGEVLGSIVAPASKAAIETFIQETLAQ